MPARKPRRPPQVRGGKARKKQKQIKPTAGNQGFSGPRAHGRGGGLGSEKNSNETAQNQGFCVGEHPNNHLLECIKT